MPVKAGNRVILGGGKESRNWALEISNYSRFLFSGLPLQELLEREPSKRSNFLKITNYFSALNFYVTGQVLSQASPVQRARAIEFWAEVALELKELGDYSSFRSLSAALTAGPLTKLHQTERFLTPKYRDHILPDLKNSTEIEAENKVLVPFIGTYLTKLEGVKANKVLTDEEKALQKKLVLDELSVSQKVVSSEVGQAVYVSPVPAVAVGEDPTMGFYKKAKSLEPPADLPAQPRTNRLKWGLAALGAAVLAPLAIKFITLLVFVSVLAKYLVATKVVSGILGAATGFVSGLKSESPVSSMLNRFGLLSRKSEAAPEATSVELPPVNRLS